MEKVTDSIINAGVNDYHTTLFENQYMLEAGMAYNSYVILDDKVAVMDSVDSAVTETWMKNLEEALHGRTVNYIVVQHMEPDHSGSLMQLIEKYPEMKIVGNAKTFQMIGQFFNMDIEDKKVIVAEGRYAGIRQPHPSFHDGADGALAGSDGDLRE